MRFFGRIIITVATPLVFGLLVGVQSPSGASVSVALAHNDGHASCDIVDPTAQIDTCNQKKWHDVPACTANYDNGDGGSTIVYCVHPDGLQCQYAKYVFAADVYTCEQLDSPDPGSVTFSDDSGNHVTLGLGYGTYISSTIGWLYGVNTTSNCNSPAVMTWQYDKVIVVTKGGRVKTVDLWLSCCSESACPTPTS